VFLHGHTLKAQAMINFQTQIYQLQQGLLTQSRDQNRKACTNLLKESQELQTLKT
jgi:hypothetical protein